MVTCACFECQTINKKKQIEIFSADVLVGGLQIEPPQEHSEGFRSQLLERTFAHKAAWSVYFHLFIFHKIEERFGLRVSDYSVLC